VVTQLPENPFARKTYPEKLQIIKNGRPHPEIPGLENVHKAKGKTFTRHFHASEFDKVLWMTGSVSLKKLFYWPCLLFVHEKTAWNKEGIANLSNLSNAIKKHERSPNHIRSQLVFATFGKSRIDRDLVEQQRIHVSRHNELDTHNRDILKSVIASVCHLAKLEAPFLGHDESSSSLNKATI
jgi:hypothetical protein